MQEPFQWRCRRSGWRRLCTGLRRRLTLIGDIVIGFALPVNSMKYVRRMMCWDKVFWIAEKFVHG